MSRADRFARRQRRRVKPRIFINVGPIGLPKMSETIRTFAAPLLARLPRDAGPTEWSVELHLAALIWNQVVNGLEREEILEEVGEAAPGRETDPVLDELIARKREQFPHDRRKIIGLDTYREHGRIQVVALSERPGISG